MLNVEFKINGQLIGFMNIHNESTFPLQEAGGACRYSYKITTGEGAHYTTEIWHKQSDGFEKLVRICLEDLECKDEQ